MPRKPSQRLAQRHPSAGSKGYLQVFYTRGGDSRTGDDTLLLYEPFSTPLDRFLNWDVQTERTPLDALCRAVIQGEQGTPLSPWVAPLLKQVIYKALIGEVTLDASFGLTATGCGGTALARDRLLKQRDLMFVQTVWKLKLCGCGVTEAIKRVVGRACRDKSWNTTVYELRPRDRSTFVETLRKKYYDWARNALPIIEKNRPDVFAWWRAHTLAHRDSLLKQFPPA